MLHSIPAPTCHENPIEAALHDISSDVTTLAKICSTPSDVKVELIKHDVHTDWTPKMDRKPVAGTWAANWTSSP